MFQVPHSILFMCIFQPEIAHHNQQQPDRAIEVFFNQEEDNEKPLTWNVLGCGINKLLEFKIFKMKWVVL